MRTIEIHGQEHPTVDDAIMELNFSGDYAITAWPIGPAALSLDIENGVRRDTQN